MNMSYIRYENTYKALLDCYEAIKEDGAESLSVSEKKYYYLLLRLCDEIVIKHINGLNKPA